MKLITTSSPRTTEHNIPILIRFMKPVFGFNSSYVSISGGNLLRQVIRIIFYLLYVYLYAFIVMYLSCIHKSEYITHTHTQ